VLYYNHVLPKPDLRLYLFGNKPTNYDMNKISDFLQIYNISLYHINITEEQRLYIYDYTNKTKETFDFNLEKKDKTNKNLSEETKLEIRTILESTDKFKFDLDVVEKWLNCQKGYLKSTLLESYKNEIDYIIIKDNTLNKPGRKLEKILLTADCFKFLCMRSKTENSHMIRKYYIEFNKKIKILFFCDI
jgi:phage anti-repressor protein